VQNFWLGFRTHPTSARTGTTTNSCDKPDVHRLIIFRGRLCFEAHIASPTSDLIAKFGWIVSQDDTARRLVLTSVWTVPYRCHFQERGADAISDNLSTRSFPAPNAVSWLREAERLPHGPASAPCQVQAPSGPPKPSRASSYATSPLNLALFLMYAACQGVCLVRLVKYRESICICAHS